MGRRLLFVVNDTAFFVSHRLPLAAAARAKGYDVHLAALPDGRLDEIEAAGVTLHPLGVDRTGLNPLADLGLILQLRKIVRALRPDVMHDVTIKPVLYGGMIARLERVPALVSAVSGLGFAFAEGGLRRRIVRFLARRLYEIALGHPNSRVIFQNDDDRGLFVGAGLVDYAKVVMIRGSGADPTLFPETEEPENDAPLVVLPARLLWDKGVREFKEAAALLKKEGVPGRFVLLGEPPAHNRDAVPLETIETWVEEGAIEYWGFRKDVPAIFAQAAIVCLPSYYREGVPKALIEAAMAGRPIVTCDWPGCRDAVEDGVSGLLCEPRSSIELARTLACLLVDRDLRARMGKKGRERAWREFSVQSVVDKTLKAYEELERAAASNA